MKHVNQMMQIIQTGFEGLIEIIPAIYRDHRGWFTESFKSDTYRHYNLDYTFVQDNLSFSSKGVLRGLHFQKQPYEQGKLIKVISGKVLDVALDLRPDSMTFGKHYKVILNGDQQNLFYLPEGFAHGFVALEDSYLFYKCTQLYHKESDSGIAYNDPELNIDWGFDNPILSEKDKNLPSFAAFRSSIGLK